MDIDRLITRAHVVRENDLAATLRVDECAGSESNARRIGAVLANEYLQDHAGCAVTVQFDDYVYVKLALGRVKTWR